jgi:hypothetical protein
MTEQRALHNLRQTFWHVHPWVQFHESLPEHDARYAVDIVATMHSQTVAGVQVKPESFKHVRPNIRALTLQRNAEFGVPVFYVHYDRQGYWTDFSALLENLKSIFNFSNNGQQSTQKVGPVDQRGRAIRDVVTPQRWVRPGQLPTRGKASPQRGPGDDGAVAV